LNHISSAAPQKPGQWQQGSKQPQVPQQELQQPQQSWQQSPQQLLQQPPQQPLQPQALAQPPQQLPPGATPPAGAGAGFLSS
jgi:hypothetical protein